MHHTESLGVDATINRARVRAAFFELSTRHDAELRVRECGDDAVETVRSELTTNSVVRWDLVLHHPTVRDSV
jgi:hypothetical protein